MTSFLSATQVDILKHDLQRLKRPYDDDQIKILEALNTAILSNDEAAFSATLPELEVGYDVRLSLNDVDVTRFMQRPDSLPEDQGGSAKPEDDEAHQPKLVNDFALKQLTETIAEIKPQPDADTDVVDEDE